MTLKEVLNSMKNIELAISEVDRIELNVTLRTVVTNLKGQGFTTEQIKEYISSKIDNI